MAKINKPDTSEVSQVVKELENIKVNNNKILSSKENELKNINNTFDHMYTDDLKECMQKYSLDVNDATLVNELKKNYKMYVDLTSKLEIAKLVYPYAIKKDVIDRVKELDQAYGNYVVKLTKEISPLYKSGLGWMLTSKDSKEKAVNAYSKLLEVRNGTYVKSSNEQKNKLESIRHITIDDTFYQEHASKIDKEINKLYGKKMTEELPIDFFDFKEAKGYKDHLDAINSKSVEFPKKYDSLITNVINDISKSITEAINDRLKHTDIEEINRDKRGFRVSTLRNAGYNTIYDITSKKSALSLKRISGIQSSAEEIYQEAQEIKKRIAEDTYFSINEECKSRLQDRIILNTDILIKNKTSISILREYKNKNGDLNIDILSDAKLWIIASNSDRNKALEAYSKVKDIYEKEYAHLFKQVTEAEKGFKTTTKAAWEDYNRNSAPFYALIQEIAPDYFKQVDGKFGFDDDTYELINAQEISQNTFHGTLFSYQKFGVKYILHEKRVLLGDEMGLGKTVQAIATMISLHETIQANRFMVLCPVAVIINWQKEVMKFSDLDPIVIHGQDKELAFENWLIHGGVAITNYESLKTLDLPEEVELTLLVVDEAHYIKNKNAQRTLATIKFCNQAQYVLFMTGTPIENKVEEMSSLISNLKPDIAEKLEEVSSNSKEYKKLCQDVYLRRKREDVALELPDKIESEVWVNLNEEEQEIYEENVLSENYMSMRQLSWDIDDVTKSSKAQALLEIYEEAKMKIEKY